MEIINEEAFRKLIKSGLSGGYLLYGDEDYMKAHAVRSAQGAVCEEPSFAFFNDMRIDAIDYTASALLDALLPLPMMSDKKIVTVNGLNVSGLKPRELDELCEVLATLKEYDYNVLIISVPATMIEEGTPKKPSDAIKRLSEHLTLVRFDPVSGAKLVNWVGKHFSHNGAQADPEVCSFLINYAGRSMYTLANETEKLAYYVLQNGRQRVTKKDVLEVSTAEITADAFALVNAIMDGRSEDAVNALAVMKFRRVDPVILMGEISRAICDLIAIKAMLDEGRSITEMSFLFKGSEYRTKLYARGAARTSMERLRSALELCAQADESVKFASQGYVAVERLICSL